MNQEMIGKFISSCRKDKGLTQMQLAEKLNISNRAVSKWENNNSVPDVVMLCTLADFFQVTTDELLGRNKQEEFIICDDEVMFSKGIVKLNSATDSDSEADAATTFCIIFPRSCSTVV